MVGVGIKDAPNNLGPKLCIQNISYAYRIVRSSNAFYFLSKGHSTLGPKIPFISNLKKPTCASKRNVLEVAILRYFLPTF